MPSPQVDLTRVNVVGVSGSGKSTFGAQLASQLGCKYIQMDELYWLPNWKERDVESFQKLVDNELKKDSWVLDGNYHSKTYHLKTARATAMIWLDMPFATTLYRAISRALRRGITRQELWPGTGNRESIVRHLFTRDSMILWTLTNYYPVRKRYLAIRDTTTLPFIHLRSPKAVEEFLAANCSSHFA